MFFNNLNSNKTHTSKIFIKTIYFRKKTNKIKTIYSNLIIIKVRLSVS